MVRCTTCQPGLPHAIARGAGAAVVFRAAPLLLVCFWPLLGCVTQPRGVDLALEYYNLGNGYLDLAQYSRAAELYQDALRLDPTLSKAKYNLALALTQGGEYEQAEHALSALLEEDPDNTTVLEALYYARYLHGAHEEALAAIERLLEVAPENSTARYNKGLVLWKMGARNEAVAEYRTLLDDSPDDLSAVYNLGALLLEIGMPADAIVHLEEYLQAKPDDTDASILLARAYAGMQKYYRALDAYAVVLSLDVRNAEAWFENAAILLTEVEDPGRGLESLLKALEYGFRDEQAIHGLLDSPTLINREEVEALLSEKNLLPDG